MKPAVRLYIKVASNLTAIASFYVEATDGLLDLLWEWASEPRPSEVQVYPRADR